MREHITPRAKLNAISVVNGVKKAIDGVDISANVESGTSGISQHKNVEDVNAMKVPKTIRNKIFIVPTYV